MIFHQRCALVVELHDRYTPAAAGLHALDIDHEYLARARQEREMRRQIAPFTILRQDRPAPAIDAQDQCGLLEIAENDRDAAVGREVGMRLVARAAKVE